MEREVRYGTLKFINESKVRESTVPINNPFKKFASILCLRFANEASTQVDWQLECSHVVHN